MKAGWLESLLSDGASFSRFTYDSCRGFISMGIILFLVDTSASMNQKTYLGTSYLDVAKVAIETFTKVCPPLLIIHPPFVGLHAHVLFDVARLQLTCDL